MIKLSKTFFVILTTLLLLNCSQVLQTVNLEINTDDNSEQEKFNVVAKTLTIKEARMQKNAPYIRKVLQNGRNEDAQPISEKVALVSKFPENETAIEYKIGVGDTLTLSRLIENNRSSLQDSTEWPNDRGEFNYLLGIGDNLILTLVKEEKTFSQTVPSKDEEETQNLILETSTDIILETRGRIGSDGSVLLLEVGRLDAKGKSLNDLRSEVRNILIRNGVSPRFQLEISEFKSQKAYLMVNSTSKVIFLNDQITTVKDNLTSANVGFKPGVITRIRLQRDSKEYIISLRKIYNESTPELYVKANDHIFVEDTSANIEVTSSLVDNQGNVVFRGIGEVKALGKSLNELRAKIKNLIQKLPDSQNAFQIQITKFASQSALVSISGKAGIVVPITDTPTTLAEMLTKNGLSFDGSSVTRIKLQRGSDSFLVTLDDLLDPNMPKVYLRSGDRITVDILPYKESKVFILGGVTPQIFKINPANRETLADVLFTSGGALSASSAKRSEVYLLRGNSPVLAYHLDAQSPTRLIVADAMELRPNDILYVAEQPIMSFNRTLATIVPLRLLLRDIQDENIP